MRTHSGRALRFAVDDDDLRHIDHAWSSTVYRAQGLTRDNVIAVLDSASMMSDRAMLYVEMSRARDGFVLLTDDTEQLVSRLEREGETVSCALEAAGQAPWLEPDMAVTAKPALWPVLAEWRAHVQRAEKAGVPPFHLEGCDALMARMGALAEKEALPGALAKVLEEHRPFAEDRAMVSKWTSSMLEIAGRRERMLAEAAAAGTAVTSLPGHAAWSRRAEGAVEEGAELLADEDRYGVHLDRIAGARAQLGEPLGELGRALEFDGNAAWLQSEWRAWERGEGDRTLEDFAARIAALASEAAPGEMPPDLSRAADEIAGAAAGSRRAAAEGRRAETCGEEGAERANRPSKSWLGRERSSSTRRPWNRSRSGRTGRTGGTGPNRRWPRRRRWRRTQRWARMPARRWRHRRRSSRAASRSTARRRSFTAAGRSTSSQRRPATSIASTRPEARRSPIAPRRWRSGLRSPSRCRRFSGWGPTTTGRGRRNGAASETVGTNSPASPGGRSRARRSGCGTRALRCARRRRSWTTG